jgi:hypothetical protein
LFDARVRGWAATRFKKDGQRLGVRHQPLKQGENTDELLQGLGQNGAEI